MSISPLQLNTFQALFSGNEKAYGQHMYALSEEGEKEKGTNTTVTDKLVTQDLYAAHLKGEKGLGIVPITSDAKCKFAVIDIDIYDKNLMPYLSAIERYNLPLVPFYSKSKGLHIYVFFRQFVSVASAQSLLKKTAKVFGISLLVKQIKNESLEIFPKQLKLAPGQTGNWINIPYFGGLNSQQAAIRNGEILNLNDGLNYIQDKVTTVDMFETQLKELPYSDAPPCIQTITMLNKLDINNGRNNFLFSCGVYLKKKDENYFETNLVEINDTMQEPLSIKELETTILASLRRKDYTYKCTVSPCVDFCDKKICQSREYGIGKDGGYFSNLIFGNMVQFAAAAPYYEWEVKAQELEPFKRLRFKNEDEIIKQDTFLRLCLRELRFLPFKMKQTEWFKLVNQALADLKIEAVAKEDDTSPLMRFHNLFYEFLTGRAMATSYQQIRAKRVFFDTNKQVYLFRAKDLIDFVYDIKGFKLYSVAEIHGLLRDLKTFKFTCRDEVSAQLRLTGIRAADIDRDYLPISGNDFAIEFKDYEEDNKEF